tara:strand:- start:383 stop:634 length:252 start_codon:yes stop_codon:yes gene_type:complete
MNSNEIKEALRTVMDFLEENEQFGDDWGPELTILNLLFHEADEVKRLRQAIENVANFPKRCPPQLKLQGVIDAMVAMLWEAIE